MLWPEMQIIFKIIQKIIFKSILKANLQNYLHHLKVFYEGLPLCSINWAVIHLGSPHLSNYPLQPLYQIYYQIFAQLLQNNSTKFHLKFYITLFYHSSNQIAGQTETCKKNDSDWQFWNQLAPSQCKK